MQKLLFALLIVPLGLLLTALAVVNRKPVALVLDPFGGSDPRLVLDVPLFLLLLGALACGLLIGGFATWLGQAKWRRMARKRAEEARSLRRQSERLERELERMEAVPQRLRLPAE